MPTTVEKADPKVAGEIIESLFEDPKDRQACLELLAEGIAYANQLGGSCWGVTLGKDFVRLNVGRVEVFALFQGMVHFVLDRSKVPERFGLSEAPDTYASLPRSITYNVFTDELPTYKDDLKPAWLAAIKGASASAKKCAYARYHSPGVIEYLRERGAPQLPSPLDLG
jgi:hypothetical protein